MGGRVAEGENYLEVNCRSHGGGRSNAPDLASRRALRQLVLLVPAAYAGAREGSQFGGISCSAGQTAGANPILMSREAQTSGRRRADWSCQRHPASRSPSFRWFSFPFLSPGGEGRSRSRIRDYVPVAPLDVATGYFRRRAVFLSRSKTRHWPRLLMFFRQAGSSGFNRVGSLLGRGGVMPLGLKDTLVVSADTPNTSGSFSRKRPSGTTFPVSQLPDGASAGRLPARPYQLGQRLLR